MIVTSTLVDALTAYALKTAEEWRREWREFRRKLEEEFGDRDKADDELVFYVCYSSVYIGQRVWPRLKLERFRSIMTLENALKIYREYGEDVLKSTVKGLAKIVDLGVRDALANAIGFLVREAEARDGRLSRYITEAGDALDLRHRLREIPGIGDTIAPIRVRDLVFSGLVKFDLRPIDIPAVLPVRRVLKRTGLIDNVEDIEQARTVVRQEFNIIPMIADCGLWKIGNEWCEMRTARRGECMAYSCPIFHICPKESIP